MTEYIPNKQMSADRPSETSFRVRIRGRVQGVGFRWWAARLAHELDLAGTVRNLGDGSVEVAAAGSPAALTRFRDALQAGPRGASVRSVEELATDSEVATAGDSGLPRPFEIVS